MKTNYRSFSLYAFSIIVLLMLNGCFHHQGNGGNGTLDQTMPDVNPDPDPNPEPDPNPTPTPNPTPQPVLVSWADTSGNTYLNTNNNSALLSGDVIGTNTSAASNLRKSDITLDVLNTNASIVLDSLQVTRSSATSTAAYVFISAVNISENTICFIKINSIIARDSGGTMLGSNSFTFVKGSTRDVGGGIYTSTCMAPGEKGYITSIFLDVYDSIHTIEIGSVSFNASSSTIPDAKIIPTSYSASADSFSTSVSVTVKNNGVSSVEAALFSSYILLDDQGYPLYYSFFDSPDWGGVYEPSVAHTLTDSLSYPGIATTIRPLIDFDPVSTLKPLQKATLLNARYNYDDNDEYKQFVDGYINQHIEQLSKQVID